MTSSEAIQRIKRHIEVHRIKEPQAIYITEALKMACDALDLVTNLKEWESRSKEIIELQDIEKESLMAENDMYRETVGELVVKDGEVVGFLNGKETKYIDKEIAETFKRIAVKTAKSEAYKKLAEVYKDQIKNYTGIFTDEGFYISLDAALNAVDFVCEQLSEEMG